MTTPTEVTGLADDDVRPLLQAATTADGVPPVSDGLLEALAAAGTPGAAPGTRIWTVQGASGAVIACGIAAVQGERGAAEAVVHPEHRAHGVGGALVRRMHADLLGTEPATWFWSHGDHPAGRHLAESLGYARERELLQLTTDPLAGLDTPEPALPAEVGLGSFTPGDEEAWLRVNNAAFDWHPEQGGQTIADIAAITAAPDFDPATVILARRFSPEDPESGRVIGFHQIKVHSDHPSGLRTGEVYVIGVDPTVHAKGVGRALTLAGLHRLRAMGAEVVELYVESDNVPARRLYESLGFVHRIVHVSYAPPA
ncbi:mycothiol synthase [Brevibacterium litoralis]|uniref:mycothiol synthase n=1 Tax=Brevibacterium litoralis TaxID=3138935 RepID=UPI0032F05F01